MNRRDFLKIMGLTPPALMIAYKVGIQPILRISQADVSGPKFLAFEVSGSPTLAWDESCHTWDGKAWQVSDAEVENA